MLKASIILPVYNVAGYLDECFASILRQTYKNFEVIVVDDGSTDGSSEVIKKYTDKYENIIYIRQKNKGLAGARNTGLKHCAGEYILFVDSDDYLDSTYVERLVTKAEETNSDIVMCSHKRVYDSDVVGEDRVVKLGIDSSKEYTGIEVAELLMLTKIEGYAWQKLFKRSELIKSEFTFEEGRLIEDFYPIFKQSYLSKKITFIDEPLYFYRQRASSITHSKGLIRIRDFKHATKCIYDYAVSEKMNKDVVHFFKIYSFKIIIEIYYSINKESKNFYKEFYDAGFGIDEPSLFKILIDKLTTNNRKLFLVFWKLRLFKLVKNMQNRRKG